MKRIMSLFLISIMILPTILLPVLASEQDMYELATLIDKACDVFPEYENTIRAMNSTPYSRTAQCATNRELQIHESRKLSQTETITYTQYTDGTILLSSTSIEFDHKFEITEGESTAGSTVYTANITVIANDLYSSTCTIKNIKYKTVPQGNDIIVSTGNISTSKKISCRVDFIRYTEDPDNDLPAQVSYYISLSVDGVSDPVDADTGVRVENNGADYYFDPR